MSKLEKEEQGILRSYEAGEWTRLRKKADLGRYQKYARATFQKDKRINIRISSKDLEGAQKKAMEEGIPYQTLISSVIHKYVAGVFVSKRA